MMRAMKFKQRTPSHASAQRRLPLSKAARRFGLALVPFALALLSPILISPVAKPSAAAERITFSLGATIERSISVESIEIYVKEGRITEELAPYMSFINQVDPDALDQARELLNQRADVDVTTLAQFAYTPQGEYFLDQVGEVFRTGARLPGGKGLRGAAIGAAADQDTGLTVLNVIQRFPTPVLRVDLRRGLAIANKASDAFEQANLTLELVEQVAFQTAAEPFPPGQSAAIINQLVTSPGPFPVRRITVRLKAGVEPVDVYLPQSGGRTGGQTGRQRLGDGLSLENGCLVYGNNIVTGLVTPSGNLCRFPGNAGQVVDFPTVVISHGLGNERESYAYLAQFLAAHGFAVINVEHPGSSADQFDALVSGRTNLVVPNAEFINRPQLITDVLNELESRAGIDKALGNVDFQNVGIIGQSFGGYTALAVAGAPLNFDQLRNHCPPEFSANISRLLQCQAVEIAPPEAASIDFTDPRIKAVVAINPITSLVFGEESLAQVDVPVMMMTGSSDTIAPSLPEQVRPFTWLTTPNRYLVMMAGGTHFSTIGITGNETFQLPPAILGPVPEVAQNYTEAMSLAFLNVHLKGDNRYQSALTSAFTTRFSDVDMPLSLIFDLSADDLNTQLRASAAGQGNPIFSPAIQQALQEIAEASEADDSLPAQP